MGGCASLGRRVLNSFRDPDDLRTTLSLKEVPVLACGRLGWQAPARGACAGGCRAAAVSVRPVNSFHNRTPSSHSHATPVLVRCRHYG